MKLPGAQKQIDRLTDRLNELASTVKMLTGAVPKRKAPRSKKPSVEPSNSIGDQVATPSPVADQSPVSAAGDDSPSPSPSSGKKPEQESRPTPPESIGTAPEPRPSGQQRDQVSAPVDDKPQATSEPKLTRTPRRTRASIPQLSRLYLLHRRSLARNHQLRQRPSSSRLCQRLRLTTTKSSAIRPTSLPQKRIHLGIARSRRYEPRRHLRTRMLSTNFVCSRRCTISSLTRTRSYDTTCVASTAQRSCL
jgi:hypothetical protein